MLILKQVVGVLSAPLILLAILIVVGVLLLKLQRRRSATLVLVLAAVFGYLSTTGLMAKVMLPPLERGYPVLDDTSLPAAKFVVVLGSAYSPLEGFSAASAMDHDGLVRIVEAVRLLRKLHGARLVLPGAVRGEETPAIGYALLARDLGVEESAIVLIQKRLRTPDTASEARQVAEYLGAEPFLLITSADHMHRSVALLRRAGARPIPAPVTRPNTGFAASDLLPRAHGLRATELAIHEYIGLAAIAVGLD
jgi:uncharacterized SAM-binding protein YcdF (DUF218 family)